MCAMHFISFFSLPQNGWMINSLPPSPPHTHSRTHTHIASKKCETLTAVGLVAVAALKEKHSVFYLPAFSYRQINSKCSVRQQHHEQCRATFLTAYLCLSTVSHIHIIPFNRSTLIKPVLDDLNVVPQAAKRSCSELSVHSTALRCTASLCTV